MSKKQTVLFLTRRCDLHRRGLQCPPPPPECAPGSLGSECLSNPDRICCDEVCCPYAPAGESSGSVAWCGLTICNKGDCPNPFCPDHPFVPYPETNYNRATRLVWGERRRRMRVYVAATRVCATRVNELLLGISQLGESRVSGLAVHWPPPRTATVVLIWHPAERPLLLWRNMLFVWRVLLPADRSVVRRSPCVPEACEYPLCRFQDSTCPNDQQYGVCGNCGNGAACPYACQACVDEPPTTRVVYTRLTNKRTRAMASTTQSPLRIRATNGRCGGAAGCRGEETVARAKRTTIAEDAVLLSSATAEERTQRHTITTSM